MDSFQISDPAQTGNSIENIHYTQDDPDQGRKVILDAKAANSSADQKIIKFQDFSLKLESKNNPPIVLRGRTGDLDRDAGVVTLQGEIKAESAEQYRFETDQLTYQIKKDLLTTKSPVKIQGPFFTIQGTGLWLDLKKQTLKIKNNTETVIPQRLVL